MAYQAMAFVYDQLMDPAEREHRAQRVTALLRQAGLSPGDPVLDLACGTGALSFALEKAAYRVTALDLSEEMLEAARQKPRASRILWVRGDMRGFSLPRPAKAVTCGCDGVNYLAREELLPFFRRVRRFLTPGGLFLFDLATPQRLEAMDGQFYGLDEENVAYLWSNHRDGDALVMELTFFIRRPDGAFERREELHRQTLFSRETLEKALEEAGFCLLVREDWPQGRQMFAARAKEEIF